MANCPQCGAALRDDYAFCAKCGTPRVATPDTTDTELLDRLKATLDEYSRIIDDVDGGRLDPAEGQRRLFAAGLIVGDGEAWILDLAGGTWCHYNGLRLARLADGSGQ